MNILSYLLNSKLAKGLRELKVQMPGGDVQVVSEVSPAGIDSAAHPDAVAVVADTLDKSSPVALGYLNEGQMAAPGEVRIYATDAAGNVLFYTWCKADGTFEMGGTEDNAVRFKPLEQALKNMVSAGINAELTKIQAALGTVGIVYARVPVSIDVSAAKINEIKTL